MKTIQKFLRTIFSWKVAEVVQLCEAETKKLDELDLYRNDNDKRRYMSWRRTSALFILPLAFVSSIWNSISIGAAIDMHSTECGYYYQDDGYYPNIFKKSLYSPYGLFITLLPRIYQYLIFLSCIHLYWRWYNFKASRLILRITWAITLFFTFAPAFSKPEWVISQCIKDIDNEYFEYTKALDGKGSHYFLESAKTVLGLKYFFQIIPTTSTLSMGVIGGCLIVRGLLPSETLSTWIFLIQAPFSSLFLFAIFMFILTSYGDAILTLSIAMFVISPWIFVCQGRKFLISFTEERKIGVFYIIYQVTTILAAILAVIFAIKFAKSLGSPISWNELGRLLVSIITQKFFMRIVMADAFLQMTETDNSIRKLIENKRTVRYGVVGDDLDIEEQRVEEGTDIDTTDCVVTERATGEK